MTNDAHASRQKFGHDDEVDGERVGHWVPEA
jgi:hypothetical protein